MSASTSIDPALRDPDEVRSMFRSIAGRYDLANHLLSGGMDFWWRHRASEMVRRWQPSRVLDLATGSGDLALAISGKLPGAEVIGADFCQEMLTTAEDKGLQKTVLADALALPFPNGHFDVVTVAFGLRNMVDWSAALREMGRVLAPGGHLLILDCSLPGRWLRPFYRLYLHHGLPLVAGLFTGQEGAYRYFAASIERFPSGQAMCGLISQSGFDAALAEPLTGGIVTIYSATRLAAGEISLGNEPEGRVPLAR